MKIVQIPLLRDNYAYLLICDKTKQAAVVDPSEAEPVLRRIEAEQVVTREEDRRSLAANRRRDA